MKTSRHLRYYKKAIKDDEALDEAYLEMAAIYAVEGKVQEAMHSLRKALQLDPDNPDYLYTAIEVYQKAGFPLDAIKTYRKIINLGYDDGDLYVDYAEQLAELDEIEDAMAVLVEGAEKHTMTMMTCILYWRDIKCLWAM
jgi:Tfp pilus assembly protein PilF